MMYYSHEKTSVAPRPRVSLPMPLVDHSLTDSVARYIYTRELSPDLAFQNYWYGSRSAGDAAPRVVIPAVNSRGTPYWQARLLDDSHTFSTRYQSPWTDRSDSLIVVLPFFTVDRQKPIVITEGPFDALAAAGCGYLSVALMGNVPPASVWDHIAQRYPGRFFILVSDCDSLGATTAWAAHLATRGLFSVIAWPQGGKDLAALPPEQRTRLLQEAQP